jgi:hypothetical protein
LTGGYIFGDWGRGRGHLFVAHPPRFGLGSWDVTEIQINFPTNQQELGQLLGIGKDEREELYVLMKAPGTGATGNTGVIYKMVPAQE